MDFVRGQTMRVSVMSKIICYLFGHKYGKETIYTHRTEYNFMLTHCSEYRCKRCGHVFQTIHTGLDWQ